MEKVFIPIGRYTNVLSQLAKWKVISQRELFSVMDGLITYQGFAKQVQKLEAEGFISSFMAHDRNKYIYLTSIGARSTSQGTDYSNSKEMLGHDLMCSMVLRELLKFKNFKTGEMLDEKIGGIAPDARIDAQRGEVEYVLAVELELHRKSKDRIREKFKKYGSSETYSYCLYVFQRPEVHNTYVGMLKSMSQKIQKKIILLLDGNLTISEFNFQDSECWFKNEVKSFEAIFA
ncbi:MAG: hypothetical protein KAQ98_13475 [Bacteriovoracaceae bacterium]|nr:hypothetical protein [Bacteriovoracaceae bacterium]